MTGNDDRTAAARPVDAFGRMPKDSPRPADEPVGYQVWHKQGGHYEYVASVESNPLGAIMMTTHGFMGYERWQDNPGVLPVPGEHRSTDIGDVLIGRDGRPLEIAADDGLRLKPVASVDRIPFDRNEAVAAFHARVEERRREGIYTGFLDDRLPWAEATPADRLEAIVMEAQHASHDGGPAVPSSATLRVIDREVEDAGLPPSQREMLQEARARMAAGQLDGPHPPDSMDRAWMALRDVVAFGAFQSTLHVRTHGGRPWAALPEDFKAGAIVRLGMEAGSPGTHTLAAIEREVDYGRLSPWRREAFQDLRGRLDRGELDGNDAHPVYRGDRAHTALGMAEFEARIEDWSHLGVLEVGGARRPWQSLSQEAKFDRLMCEVANLYLGDESKAYEVIGREVDLARLPLKQRREFEEGRAGAWPRPEREADAFDRVVADLPRLWREDGHGDAGETWEEWDAVEKIGYLAGHAAEHKVPFWRFVEAAGRTLGLEPGREFTADDEWHLSRQFRWAHGDYSAGDAKSDRGQRDPDATLANTPSDYGRMLDAAAERAKHEPPDKSRGPKR